MSKHIEAMKKFYDKILKKYDSDEYENYRDQEELIKEIFSEKGTFAHLNLRQIVLLKVSVLDSFYSTNLAKFGIYEVAKHITELEQKEQIHQKIYNANPQNYDELRGIIKQIAECEKSKKDEIDKKSFYSFATKYCFHHNQNAFRIYDSFVREVLVFFNNGTSNKNNTKFADIPSELVGTNFFGEKLIDAKLRKIDNYNIFLKTINRFAEFYGLKNESTRDLDHFLWILGKEQKK